MWPTIPKPVEGNGHPNVQKALVEMNPKKHILREIIFRLSKSEIGDFGSSAVKVTYHIQERLVRRSRDFSLQSCQAGAYAMTKSSAAEK